MNKCKQIKQLHAKRLHSHRRLTTWMNDFWDFAFVVAKHWDKDPASWARKESLLIKSHKQRLLEVDNSDAAPLTIQESSSLISPSHQSAQKSVEPEKLCRWTVHVPLEPDASKPMDESSFRMFEVIGISCNTETSVPELSKSIFVGLAGPGTEPETTTWKDDVAVQQPLPNRAPTLHEILSRALEAERFSRVGAQQLPIYASQVARAIRCSNDEMWKDSVRLAILGRNIELLERTLYVSKTRLKLIEDVHPLHLAATYLDGSKSCCQIMHYLLDRWLGDDWQLSQRNPAGYTLLDSLLLTILRNHSSAPVGLADEALRDYPAFVGEEVNSCGMWDAESEVFRTHMKCGNRAVPKSWKHKFCHTSVLSVCHCIEAINAAGWILPSSGLFLRCCLPCGMRLQLSPLHSIVFTAFLLVHYGCAGEDLFGMICCLLQYVIGCCRRRTEFAPQPISIELLLDPSEQLGCTHRLLRPAELANQLSVRAQKLGVKSPMGWFAFVAVLHTMEAQYLWAEQGIIPVGHTQDHQAILRIIKHKRRKRNMEKPPNDRTLRSIFRHCIFRSECNSLFFEPCQHPDWYDPHRCFGRSRLLGHLWAACQAELLTYRRHSDSDPWLSSRFSIEQIFRLLCTGDPNSLSYVNQRLLRRYCICGMYDGWQTCPVREQVCSYNFSNLDVTERAEYLDAEKKECSEEADADKRETFQEGQQFRWSQCIPCSQP